jgi:hypothetical protein
MVVPLLFALPAIIVERIMAYGGALVVRMTVRV